MTRETHTYVIRTMAGVFVTSVNAQEGRIRDVEKTLTKELGQRVRAHSC